MWTDKGIKTIEITPTSKIEQAHRTVQDALHNRLPYCYGRVKRTYTHEYGKIKNRIEYLSLGRMRHQENDTAWKYTAEMAELRCQLKDHIVFDEKTYRTMRSNYNRLYNALVLLESEMELEAFTLRPDGTLNIRWFEVQDSKVFDVHFQVLKDEPLPDPPPLSNKVPIPAPIDEAGTTGKKYGQYKIAEVKRKMPHEWAGWQGELDPARLLQRDRHAEGFRTQTRALYLRGKDLRENGGKEKVVLW
jgi:hypothetical protein